jgi:aldehyde:ferredoxin oxidoreductase
MNFNNYREIKPKVKIFKKIYVAVMLFVFGRAFQAAYGVDRVAKAEFDSMPEDFVFDLCVLPNGPHMIIGKNDKGKIKYLGWNPEGKKITLKMQVKSIEGAMLMFTFQESSCLATARDRLVVDGDIPTACGILRMMDLLEILLLPKFVAKLGVKRYPAWSKMSPIRKYISRVLVYIRIVTG